MIPNYEKKKVDLQRLMNNDYIGLENNQMIKRSESTVGVGVIR